MRQQGRDSQTATQGLWCYTDTTAIPNHAETKTLHAAAQQTQFKLSQMGHSLCCS